jgi:hypothetical protein
MMMTKMTKIWEQKTHFPTNKNFHQISPLSCSSLPLTCYSFLITETARERQLFESHHSQPHPIEKIILMMSVSVHQRHFRIINKGKNIYPSQSSSYYASKCISKSEQIQTPSSIAFYLTRIIRLSSSSSL